MLVQRQYFINIEFENSIRKIEFCVPSTGQQNCLDKSLVTEREASRKLILQINYTFSYE